MQPSQQPQVVVQPSPMYMVSSPPQTVETYNKKQSMGLGITLIVAGGLSIIFYIVVLGVGTKYAPGMAADGTGIWMGAAYIVAGSLGVGAARNNTRCMIITFMVLSIIVCVLSGIHVIVASLGAAAAGIAGGGFYYTCNGEVCNDVRGLYAMSILLALCAATAFIASLWGSIMCCATGGCCCSYTPVQPRPVMTGAPQVTIVTTQYQPGVAYPNTGYPTNPGYPGIQQNVAPPGYYPYPPQQDQMKNQGPPAYQ